MNEYPNCPQAVEQTTKKKKKRLKNIILNWTVMIIMQL